METLDLTDAGYAHICVRTLNLADGQKAASVFDIIDAAGSANCRKLWRQLLLSYPNVLEQQHQQQQPQQHKPAVSKEATTSQSSDTSSTTPTTQEHPDIFHHQFEGSGQRPTPVANARGISRVLSLLPGTRFVNFRARAGGLIATFLGGEPSENDAECDPAPEVESLASQPRSILPPAKAAKPSPITEEERALMIEEKKEKLKRMATETEIMKRKAEIDAKREDEEIEMRRSQRDAQRRDELVGKLEFLKEHEDTFDAVEMRNLRRQFVTQLQQVLLGSK